MKNDVCRRRRLREGLGRVTHRDVRLLERFQHGQLRRSRISQDQKVHRLHGETSILRHVQRALDLVQPVVQLREPVLLRLKLPCQLPFARLHLL